MNCVTQISIYFVHISESPNKYQIIVPLHFVTQISMYFVHIPESPNKYQILVPLHFVTQISMYFVHMPESPNKYQILVPLRALVVFLFGVSCSMAVTLLLLSSLLKTYDSHYTVKGHIPSSPVQVD